MFGRAYTWRGSFRNFTECSANIEFSIQITAAQMRIQIKVMKTNASHENDAKSISKTFRSLCIMKLSS